jgi:hypothetical protein
MKKLFIMLCFAFAAIISMAQNTKKAKTGSVDPKKKLWEAIAILSGPNSSTLTGDNASENKSLLGIHAGIGIQVINFSDALGIRSEIIYSQQGDKYSYGENGYNSEIISRLNYLNLPVMLHYRSKSGFFAEAGLQPGLLLSAKEKSTTSGMGGGGAQTTDIKKELNSFALGVPIGAGFLFKKKFAVSARVTPGLLNVDKKDGAFSDLTEKNLVLSARVSYFL